MKQITLLVLSLGLLGQNLAHASPVKAVSRIELDRATLDGSVTNAYSDVRMDLLQNLGEILEASPFIKHASLISVTETSTPLQPGSVNKMVKGERTLLLKGMDKKLLPESLYSVLQNETLCLSTKDCFANLELKIVGPVANYKPDVELTKMSSLNNTFEIVIRANPMEPQNLGGASRISISLNILNRSYMEYFKSLKLSEQAPSERDIQKGFLLWAQQAFNRIGN